MLAMFKGIVASPWTGAVTSLCSIVWEGFWLIGPPIGIGRNDRKPYLLWGLAALSIAGFQAFYTLLRENRRLKEKLIKGNLPCLAPDNYKKQSDGRFGLVVHNSEYDAYDVHIPDTDVGESGYKLQFNGIYSHMRTRDERFFEVWLDSADHGGVDGSALFRVMSENNIRAVYFGIVSKDSSPVPNWYRDNCAIFYDQIRRRDGLRLTRIGQEAIPAPIID
jgi:hypothetical protein